MGCGGPWVGSSVDGYGGGGGDRVVMRGRTPLHACTPSTCYVLGLDDAGVLGEAQRQGEEQEEGEQGAQALAVVPHGGRRWRGVWWQRV